MAGANVWIVRAGRHHDAPLARAKAELRGSGQKTASNQLITDLRPDHCYLRTIGYNAWVEDTNGNEIPEKALKMAIRSQHEDAPSS